MKIFNKDAHVQRAIVVNELPEDPSPASAALFDNGSVALQLQELQHVVTKMDIDVDAQIDPPEGALISFCVVVVTILARNGARWIIRRFRNR